LIDGVVRKLKSARFWTTSADDYNREFKMALRLLEEVKRKLEEKS